jgi:ATP-binding cassette subfamily G (WHITE) protein 2 (SNQ2)
MCSLENYAEAIVGTLGVEHKKRVTIVSEPSLYSPAESVLTPPQAVELAAKPSLLLFLDEPTSGRSLRFVIKVRMSCSQTNRSGQSVGMGYPRLPTPSRQPWTSHSLHVSS